MVKHTLELDVVPGGAQKTIHLNQNDSDFTLEFHLVAGGAAELSIDNGTPAKIQGRKCGGAAYEATATLAGTTVTVAGDSALTDTAGTGLFELCLTHNSAKLHSTNFNIVVEPTPVSSE